jgi:hypothetical protein
MFEAALRGCDPMPIEPGRILPDILMMTTFQIGNPLEGFIQVVIHDLAWDADRRNFKWLQVIPLATIPA